MVQPLKAFFKEAFLISTIPFLTKGVAFLLGSLQETLFYQSHHQDQNPSDSGDYHFISWIYDQLIANNVYSDYRVFIGTMMSLSLIVSLLKISYQSTYLSENQQNPLIHSEEASSSQEKGLSRRKALYSFSRLMICYTLIFSIIIITSNSFFNKNNPQFPMDHQRLLSQVSEGAKEEADAARQEE